MHRFETLPLNLIDLGAHDPANPIRIEYVYELQKSLVMWGQITSIHVKQTRNGRYHVINGRHRVAAMYLTPSITTVDVMLLLPSVYDLMPGEAPLNASLRLDIPIRQATILVEATRILEEL